MDGKRVKTVHDGMLDRISHLPTHVIERILKRMPLKDAARTSILSTTWRDMWPNRPRIVLDRQFYQENFQSKPFEHDFASFISRILSLHVGPILKFHLHIPNIAEFDITPEMDRWLQHVLSKNTIKRLTLENLSGSSYKLPHYVFECPKLKSLMLENCLFEPPHGFGGFCKLTHLWLVNVSLSSATSETLLLGAPVLLLLVLHNCKGTFRLRGHGRGLKHLFIFAISEPFDFELSESCPSLHEVHLLGQKPERVGIPNHEKGTKFLELFENMPQACHLIFSGSYLKSLAEGRVLQQFPNPVKFLTRFILCGFNFNELYQIRSALCILRSSVSLRNLRIHSHVGRVFDQRRVVRLLKDPNCLRLPLPKLQNVSLYNVKGMKAELLFIKLLLDKSPSLETMRIEPRKGIDAVESSKIIEESNGYPRASTKVQMIYTETQPKSTGMIWLSSLF